MKFKKLISICLIISILLTTLCPTSFAAYIYGPESSSYTVDWKNEGLGGASSSEGDDRWGAVEIRVTKSGIYNVSNVMGGNVTTQFVICGEIPKKGLSEAIAPLPVATYGINNESTMNISRYNKASSRTASVYLEAGQTYYICMTGEKNCSNLKNSSPSESNTLTINLEYIKPNEGEQPYETTKSSADFTAPMISIGSSVHKYRKFAYIDDICKNPNLESISGDSLNSTLEDAATTSNESQNAAWYEQIITWFLLLIGDSVRAIITWALGDNISIDNILFNEYDNIRLAIFDSSRVEGKKNGYLETSGMLDTVAGEGVITKYFIIFRNIAIAVYIVMLLYMGVNILMSSTGGKKAKYKDRIVDWIKGIVILVFFPYMMKYTIVLNDAIVQYISDLRGELPSQINLPTMTGISNEQAAAMNLANSSTATNGDMMQTMRVTAGKTGRVAYAILYLLLLKELIGFIYIYFKRLISVIFLIIIFPLVTISYAVDKIADGKSQAFNKWFSEFVLNVFMQSFQAVNYVVIMSIIFSLAISSSSVNIILVLVGFEYISKGDELLRSMFSKMSGGGANTVPNSLNDAVKTVATVKVAQELGKQVTSTGRRVKNLTTKVRDVKSKYYNYQEAKHNDRERNKLLVDDWFENSIMNPEKHAIDDVHGNIEKVLRNSGQLTSEEQKQILDRLTIAKNDPNRSQAFQNEYNSLSDDDKEYLSDLLIANEVFNETINGNRGARGPLTQREINFNAKINMEIVNGGSTGKYGALYDFASSKNMLNADGTQMLDRNGNPISALEYIEGRANERALNENQQRQFNKAQNFLGNVTGLDTSEFGTSRVSTSRHNPLPVAQASYSETARANSIQRRFGTTGASAEIADKQARASKLVARMQGYKFQLDQGTSQGMSATEGMKLAMEWEELAQEADSGVQAILNQLGDAHAAGHAMEANVGFNMEQFKTMASLAVMKDKANLQGTEEEKRALIQEAGKTIVEVATGQKFETDGNGHISARAVRADKVARAMVQRAEMDDFIRIYGGQYINAARNNSSDEKIDCSQYMNNNATQEEIRDARELARRRKELEEHYENAKVQTASQARAELFRSATNTAGAATSVVLTPASVASGVVTSALVTGASGDTNLLDVMGTAAAGVALEHSVESLIPGTEPSSRSSSKGLGARMDKAAGNAINDHGLTAEQRSDELLAWDKKNNSVSATNNLYRNRLGH